MVFFSISCVVSQNFPDFSKINGGDNLLVEFAQDFFPAGLPHLLSFLRGKLYHPEHLLTQIPAVPGLAEESADAVVHHLAASGNIGSDDGFAHSGPFEERTWHPFAVGGQDHTMASGDFRPDILR